MKQVLRAIDRKIFGILLAASLVGVLAVLPLALDMVESAGLEKSAAADFPVPLLVLLTLLQNGVLLALAIAVGMVLAALVGLRMPLLSAWTRGERVAVRPVLLPGALLGAAAGMLLVAMDALLFLREFSPALLSLFDIPLWKRLLAGVLYGGITEEVLMRLFLVSLVAWLLGRFRKTPEGQPTAGAFWGAILLVAVLFGLGHLPVTAAITPLTPALVARALLLNGVAGVAFGYLYWRHGLEAAMVGHAAAHLVLQIPGVMLLKTLM
jgi:membrane protease YdiL (CAAX protease family)